MTVVHTYNNRLESRFWPWGEKSCDFESRQKFKIKLVNISRFIKEKSILLFTLTMPLLQSPFLFLYSMWYSAFGFMKIKILESAFDFVLCVCVNVSDTGCINIQKFEEKFSSITPLIFVRFCWNMQKPFKY